MGRPRKDPTPKITEAICRARALGLSWEHCAAQVKMSKDTVLYWRKRGAAGEQPYSDFLVAVQKAESDAIDKALDRIKTAGEKSWQASAWWLERRYPQRFGRIIREYQGKGGGPVEFRLEWQKPIGGSTDQPTNTGSKQTTENT